MTGEVFGCGSKSLCSHRRALMAWAFTNRIDNSAGEGTLVMEQRRTFV